MFHLMTSGTLHAEIYDRCLSRIRVFKPDIGGNEEILGDLTRELHSIAETFALTAKDRALRLHQLSDNKIRQIEEEQKLEDRQGELFGLNLAAASWEHTLPQSRNFWLEPVALASAVSTYLTQRLGKEQDYLLGDKPLKTLRLSLEARAALLDDFRRLPRCTDPTYRAWERWLKGAIPTLQVTFDQECAVENATAVLLSLGHPILRQAAAHLQQTEAVVVQLRATHESLPEGVYPFAIYRWSRQGAKRDEELVPVVGHPEIASNLLPLLQISLDAPELELPMQQVWDDLDAVHHQQWLGASAEHAEDNRQLVGVRIQSLTSSHRARSTLLEGQIACATNDKIRLMKRSELGRAQVDFDSRIAQLSRAAESGDIRATPAVFGVIDVRRTP